MSRADGVEIHRLAVYGTPAPGRPNHHHLEGLKGRWSQGVVRGRLRAEGWGADMGFPGLVLDPGGRAIEVQMLDSADLPDHWAHLDAFEGPGYRRVLASVQADGEIFEAWIYVLA